MHPGTGDRQGYEMETGGARASASVDAFPTPLVVRKGLLQLGGLQSMLLRLLETLHLSRWRDNFPKRFCFGFISTIAIRFQAANAGLEYVSSAPPPSPSSTAQSSPNGGDDANTKQTAGGLPGSASSPEIVVRILRGFIDKKRSAIWQGLPSTLERAVHQ